MPGTCVLQLADKMNAVCITLQLDVGDFTVTPYWWHDHVQRDDITEAEEHQLLSLLGLPHRRTLLNEDGRRIHTGSSSGRNVCCHADQPLLARTDRQVPRAEDNPGGSGSMQGARVVVGDGCVLVDGPVRQTENQPTPYLQVGRRRFDHEGS